MSGGRFSKLEPTPSGPATPEPEAARAPRDAAFHLEAAAKAEARGRHEEAYRAFSRALEQDRSLAAPWAGSVRMLAELGDLRQAAAVAARAREALEDAPDVLAAEAIVAARSGDGDRAMRLADTAHGAGPTPDRCLARAEALLAARLGGEAHAILAAERLGGGSAPILIRAARLLRRYRRAPEALLIAERARSAAPDSAAAWLEVGLCQRDAGMRREALAALGTACRLDHELPGAKAALRELEAAGPLAFVENFVRRALGSFRGESRR